MELLPQEHVFKPESATSANSQKWVQSLEVSCVSRESNDVCSNHFAKPCTYQTSTQGTSVPLVMQSLYNIQYRAN